MIKSNSIKSNSAKVDKMNHDSHHRKMHHNRSGGSGDSKRKKRGNESSWKNKSIYSVMKRFRKNKVAVVGLCIIFFLVVVAALAPLIAPYDYATVDPSNAFCRPCREHLFGTDNLGRDVFSRIIYGTRYSLTLAVASQTIAAVIGVILGSIAGFFGNRVDNVIMRCCDILQSVPGILLNICVSQALGSGYIPTVVALSVAGITNFVRATRASILSVREQEFVEAARAIDCTNRRIIFKHILPNSFAPVIMSYTSGLGTRLVSSAGLSYLGLGILPPIPEWGAMLADGKVYFRYHPHLIIVPGIFIAITVLSFNMMGDGLRDAMDPKLRN